VGCLREAYFALKRDAALGVDGVTWEEYGQEECLAQLILFGEASLRYALTQYVAHFHHERNHQGKGNVLLFPPASQDKAHAGPVRCRERLGGLLQYYERDAA
jgi:hypothetical protein